jgi:hypothetical protein
MKTNKALVWPAAIALALTIGACGSSSSKSTATTASTATSNGSVTTSTTVATTSTSSAAANSGAGVNVAADQALAQSINLTSADLSGWTSSPDPETAADRTNAARLAQCDGAPKPANVDVVRVNSPYFDKGQTEVSSNVTTVRSPADGLADLRAVQSSRLIGCLRQIAVPYLESTLPSGTKVVSLSVSRLSLSAFPGLPTESFVYRLAVTVSITGQGNLAITSDTIGGLDGRAEVGIDVTQSGGTPDPTLENQLISLLVGRTRTAVG